MTGYIEDNGCVDTLQWSMMPHSVLLQHFTINHSNPQGPYTGHHIQDDNTPPPKIGNSRPTNSTPCRSMDQETERQGLEHHGSVVNNPPSLTSPFW